MQPEGIDVKMKTVSHRVITTYATVTATAVYRCAVLGHAESVRELIDAAELTLTLLSPSLDVAQARIDMIRQVAREGFAERAKKEERSSSQLDWVEEEADNHRTNGGVV